MAESRYSQYFFILGEPIFKWKVYVCVASILIFVFGGAGFIYYTMLKNKSATLPVAPVASARPAAAILDASSRQVQAGATAAEVASVRSELNSRTFSERKQLFNGSRSPLERLLEQHLLATGMDQVTSYVVEGTVAAEPKHEVVLMGRAPNLYKLKTKNPASGTVVEFGNQPQGAWLRENSYELSRERALYFAKLSVIEGSLNHLAWSFLSEEASEYGLDTVLELLPSESWEGVECAVVLSHGVLPVAMHHYIDRETYREIYRWAEIPNPEGEMVKVGIHYDPPMEAAGLAFPAGYELHVNGEVMDDVAFTKFRNDRVILSSLFDPPSDCSFTGL